LAGDKNDYSVTANGGVGSISINGEKPSENKNGKYNIRIDGGVGNVNININ
jgi:hypothetical protein